MAVIDYSTFKFIVVILLFIALAVVLIWEYLQRKTANKNLNQSKRKTKKYEKMGQTQMKSKKLPPKSSLFESLCKSKWMIISILLLIAILVPSQTHSYNVDVPYEDTETYTEKEAYDEIEYYDVQTPYEDTEVYYDQVPIEKTETHTAEEGMHFPSCDGDCYCTDYTFFGDCVKCTCEYTVHESIEKERAVIKYRTETKQRTVTKYRDVPKTRTVIKIRQEERYEQRNWLFKFRVPWKLNIF
jgi:hypothetical protein